MRVGMVGPADLSILRPHLNGRTPATSGYSAPLVSHLALELVRRGHDLSIITLSGDTRDLGHYQGERLSVRVLRNRDRLRWIDAFRAERSQIRDAIDHSDCEVLHAHWTYEFALAALATGRPTVVTVHDWAPEVLRYQMHPYRIVRLSMQRRTLQRARHVTTVSPYLAAKVNGAIGRPPELIPNGIAMPANPPHRSRSNLSVVGALNSGFGRRKNVSALLEAFSLLRTLVPGLRLRLAGPDYEESGPAAKWAQSRNLADSVEFIGALTYEGVPDFLRSLDLFVHPSREESFGMVLVEALLQGTPVIAGSESGAVPWVLGDGEAGMLVDVSSPSAIAAAIRLHVRSDFLAESAARGYHYVSDNFSLATAAEAYERCYQTALDAL